MQNFLEQYKNIKPSADWVRQTEKNLKAVMPKSQWPIYSVVFVLALGLSLSLSLVLREEPEKPVGTDLVSSQKTQNPLTPEQTKTEIAKTIKKATKVAKKIEEAIEEKILAVKTKTSQQDEIDPLIKLSEDLENAKATREFLEEIEKDIENNDYVIARQKLDKWLSLEVDSEKRNDNN